MRLLNMCPSHPILNLPHGGQSDPVVVRDCLHGPSIVSYLQNYFGIKYCVWAARPYGKCSVASRIISIFFTRSPSKIGENVVDPHAIPMTSFVIYGRSWADESLKNKNVDTASFPLPVLIKSHYGIAYFANSMANLFSFEFHRTNAALNDSVYRADSPAIGHFIETFIANNFAPLFHTLSPRLGIHMDHYTGGENG